MLTLSYENPKHEFPNPKLNPLKKCQILFFELVEKIKSPLSLDVARDLRLLDSLTLARRIKSSFSEVSLSFEFILSFVINVINKGES